MTDLTATTLAAQGLPLIQSESAIARGYQMLEAGQDVNFLQLAREVGATHAIIGTVHEYRFKSDLDGAPTVGLSLRLVDAGSGQTVWQGSSSRSSGYYSSLTGTAQGAIDQLVGEMSGRKSPRIARTKTVRNTAWWHRDRANSNSRSISNKPTPAKKDKPAVEFEQIRRRSGTVTTVETNTSYETAPTITRTGDNVYVPPPIAPTYTPRPTPPPTAAPTPSPESQWIPVR